MDLDGEEKEADKIRMRFCNKILGFPRFARNSVELGRESMRGEVLSIITKYYLHQFALGFSGSNTNY
jgi:hypothetical protein